MRTRGSDPVPDITAAPVAGRKQDFPPGCTQCHTHSAVQCGLVRTAGMIAVIIFQIIHTPLGECFCVKKLMIIRTRIVRARSYAVTGIHTEFQALAVYIICHCLHTVRELHMMRYDPIRHRIAFILRPAVINHQVFIACIFQAKTDHGICRLMNQVFVNLVSEGVPCIESHGWSGC